MSTAPSALLEIRNLSVHYPGRANWFFQSAEPKRAVDGISFTIPKGKTVGLVGESGSGKSVTALALTRLLPPAPGCVLGGSVRLQGVELLTLPENQLAKVRGGSIAYIFQEPGSSLNPVYTIGFQIGEAISLHRPEIKDVRAEVIRALTEVHINDPARVAEQYPHELSGGMQQRAMIAMALACDPKILVADEPTTALDVTIQKEIMDLLARLRRERGMSIILITHNFGIIANFADKVQVMWKGHIVESGPVAQVMSTQTHPYTKALIACIPRLGQRRRRLTTLSEELKVSR